MITVYLLLGLVTGHSYGVSYVYEFSTMQECQNARQQIFNQTELDSNQEASVFSNERNLACVSIEKKAK